MKCLKIFLPRVETLLVCVGVGAGVHGMAGDLTELVELVLLRMDLSMIYKIF